MSWQRNVKKAVYGAIPLVIIVVIVGLIALPERSATPLQPTIVPGQETLPVEIQSVSVVPHPLFPASESQTVDIVAKLFNPNARAGIEDYALGFTLLDTQGQAIKTVTKTTYVLPGSVQYVPVLNVSFPLGVDLGRIEVNRPASEEFTRLPANVALPQFSLFLREREEKNIGALETVVQRGIVRNTSTFDWQRVEVQAVALDSAGGIVGVGETFVGRLLVGEQREFTLEWPKSSQSINQVIAVPSTNMFKEENVVEVIGDPANLR